MFRVFAGGALAAVFYAGASHAAPSVVTNPDWLVRPDGRTIAETYPRVAARLQLDGRALISCVVDVAGHARDCMVIEQIPPGLGFGAATLKASEAFRFHPKKIDGRPVGGGTVRIPLRYTHPDIEAPDELPNPGPPTSAKVAALTPALSAQIRSNFLTYFAGDPLGVETEPQPDVEAATRAAARRAVTEAGAKVASDWAQATASTYAAHADEAQMTAVAAYMSDPESVATFLRQARTAELFDRFFEHASARLRTAARAGFCTGGRCDAQAPQPAVGVTLTKPAWKAVPSWHDIDRSRPRMAWAFGVGGWAQLNCIVTATGTPEFCVNIAESPRGFGFGAAADLLVEDYRLSDEDMASGAEGETVSLLVEFPPPWIPPTGPPEIPGPPPSATQLALAREVVAIDGQGEKVARSAEETEAALAQITGLEGEERRKAAESLRRGIQQALPGILDELAVVVAKMHTERELLALKRLLSAMAVINDGPGRPRLNADLSAVNAYYGQQVVAEARRIFCADRLCCEVRNAKP